VWVRGEVHTEFWSGNLRERDHLKNPGVDGKIILKFIFKKCNGVWIGFILAQDRDGWRAFINAAMNLRVP
jgi:hypothetical protein